MKRNLLAVVAAGAIALGGFIITQAQANSASGCAHGHAFGLREFTDTLNLTAEQQTKVQPILDQAKPELPKAERVAVRAPGCGVSLGLGNDKTAQRDRTGGHNC